MRLSRPPLRTLLLAAVTACGGGGETTTPPPAAFVPVVSSITVIPGVAQAEVGATATVAAEVRDQRGVIFPGKTVTWASSNPAVATIDAGGVVRAVALGSVTLTAAVDGKQGIGIFNSFAPPVTSVTITPPAGPLSAGQVVTLVVTLRDRNGAEATGRPVTWTSSSTRIATVTNAGVVTAVSPGTATITALSEGISGTAAVVVAAPAGTVLPTITSIAPATLRTGETATINGSGFSTVAANNGVFVAGLPVAVTAATPTQLSIALPTTGLPCQSAVPVDVEVSTTGGTASARQPLSTSTVRSLAVGGSVMLTAGNGVACNELPTSGTYLVSVFNASRSAQSTEELEFRGSPAGVAASRSSPAPIATSIGVAPRAVRSSLDPRAVADAREHTSRMERDAQLVRELGSPRRYRRAPRSSSISGSAGGASRASVPVPTTVGENAQLKFHFNSCTAAASVPITARVVFVGAKTIVLEDNAGVLAGKIDADLVALGKEFDEVSYPLLTNFGDPLAYDAETDANGRIIMLFTPQVNAQGSNLLGFVSACDLYPPTIATQVGASNQAEIFYARAVTDTSPTSTSLNGRPNWRRQMPSTLIHETKHILSYAERFATPVLIDVFEQTWLEEATAQMASEMYGRALRGNTWRSNSTYFGTLDCEVRPSNSQCGGGVFVMGNHFGFLTDYLQNLETKSIISGSEDSDIYGSSWLFTRWLTDTYGGTSERGFLTQIVKNWNVVGVDNVVSVTGKTWAELLSQFTLMLAADDLPNVGAPFVTASWNLPGIFSGYNTDFPNSRPAAPLNIRPVQFGSTFLVNPGHLKGGGAMLLRFAPGGGAGGQLLELRRAGSTALPTSSSLGMAVLRVQ